MLGNCIDSRSLPSFLLTTLLHMKNLDVTETLIFILLCVQCFQVQPIQILFINTV